MPAALRGARYLTRETEPLARFILDELPYLDFKETCGWYAKIVPLLDLKGQALLGANDRYFLLTGLLHRVEMLHPWLFDRTREVEADPDGHLDLWARGHFKSTIITYAGNIQDILVDPEIKIAIFSVVKPIAQAFLGQIKEEFENNDHLKAVYPDVLYQNPRGIGPDGKPAKWGLARGITVKRKGNPKEATLEAHGLIDGQPTSRHYDKLTFDDVVTQDYTGDEQIRKTTLRFEMADNLGTHLGVRKQVAGTFYHFNDTYVQMRDRGSLKARIYPATDDGTLNGAPVLLSVADWEKKKRDQRSTISTQMLLNPTATGEATFKSIWLRTYDIVPSVLNVYILIDPSKGKGQRSDRTAIAVVGIDQAGNKYLLDGVRHRMRLSDRWHFIKLFKAKWEKHPGVQLVRVGYEQYGMVDDITVLEEMMDRENNHFEIVELKSPESGSHAKPDRIERLEPDFRGGKFYLPCVVHHPDVGGENGTCYWSVWTEATAKAAEEQGIAHNYAVGQIVYRPMRVDTPTRGLTKNQLWCETSAQTYRIVKPLKRRDENNDIYDVTRGAIAELIQHPFAPHDDFIDALARIYDIEPSLPVMYEAQSTESLDVDRADALVGAEG